MVSESAGQFLNVDLEIVSTEDPAELAAALEPEAFVLQSQATEHGHLVCLELSEDTADADSTVRRFIEIIARLPPPLRMIWERAARKTFDVGVQMGLQSHLEVLAPETIHGAAALGAGITFTAYPPKIDEKEST